MKEFRLLRDIIVPESIPDDTNGINWLAKTEGFLFGFDTDEDGERFEVRELYCEYEVGSVASSPGTGGFVLKNSTAEPEYGTLSDGSDALNVRVVFGKNGGKSQGWFRVEPMTSDKYMSYGADFGGAGFMQMYSSRRIRPNTYMPITTLSTHIVNEAAFGFAPGSRFTFYGR